MRGNASHAPSLAASDPASVAAVASDDDDDDEEEEDCGDTVVEEVILKASPCLEKEELSYILQYNKRCNKRSCSM